MNSRRVGRMVSSADPDGCSKPKFARSPVEVFIPTP
jgi:hypothetical protein